MVDKDKMPGNVSTGLLIKSSFWYTLSGFLTRAIGFITIPIFTRILTNEQVGDFAVFTSWLSVFVAICGIELSNTINRARFDFNGKNEFDGYISSCLVLNICVTAIFFGLYLIFPEFFFRIFLVDSKNMIVMFLYLFTFPSFTMMLAKQRVMYKYKFSAGMSLTLVLSSSIFAVLLALNNQNDRLFGRIFGQYFLYVVAGLVCLIYFLVRSISIRKIYIKYALRIGIPLAFSVLGNNILLSADSLVVKHMCDGVQVSYIAIVHSAAHIVLMLVQAINSAWAPWLFDKLNIGQLESVRKAYKVIVWIVVLGTVVVLLVGPEIILILGGKNYSEAVSVLPANIMSGVMTILTSMMVNIETYHKKPEYAAIITGIVGVINILGNIVGVMLWDYKAVCYVTFACQILSVLMHFRFTYSMNVKSVLSTRDLTIVIMLTIIMIPVCLALYTSNIIRLITVGLFFVVGICFIYFNKDKILSVIKSINR